MQDRWIILTTYYDIRDANEDADKLNLAGIRCQVVTYDAGHALFPLEDEEQWIGLEVQEDDYEAAADLLDLRPHTVESIYEEVPVAPNAGAERRKRNRRLWIWSGIVLGAILLRLMMELWG
ncbi:MAG: hypothetical protein D6730_16940 [Bacteroidetes bacterium]|nr:MAG: hypothetical protein D6730_16940 [Bacteroidota bacterium]